MFTYLVLMPDGQEAVTKTFGSRVFPLSDDLWAVGSEMATSSEVCKALGIEDSRTMLVVSLVDFYGWHDRALWQQLDAWGKS